MSIQNKFKTVKGFGTAETEDKKSKFIAHVFPVETEDEAAAHIRAVRKKHYNATHNVFAYSIGLSGEHVKASDDGEPSGTAGMPVLDIIRRENINNVLIVVTRYFGGTLLGTGGLVRAYGRAAKEGLKAAGVVVCALCTRYELSVDYNISGKLSHTIEKEGYALEDTLYTDIVTFVLIIETELKEQFLKTIENICQGCELLEEKETEYVKI